MKTEGLAYACRVRGSDLAIQSERTAEVPVVIPRFCLVDFAVADAFERAGLLKDRGDAAGNLEGLLVMSAGLGGIGDGIRITEVVEYLSLAQAVTQIAIQLQRAGQGGLSGEVVVRHMLGYAEVIERVSLAQPVIQAAVEFQRVGVTGG